MGSNYEVKYRVRYAFRAPSVNDFITNETIDQWVGVMDPDELRAAIEKGFIVPRVLPDEPEEPPRQLFGDAAAWRPSRASGEDQQPPVENEEAPARSLTPFRRRASDEAAVPTPTDGGQ
jgi:hypothetical protein